MADIPLEQLKERLRSQRAPADASLEELRLAQEKGAARLRIEEGVVVEAIRMAGCRAEWLTPRNRAPKRALVYLHGGAFVAGSCATHRPLAARIAQEAQMRTLLLEYRLAPEHPWPAAEDDVYGTWHELLTTGYAAEGMRLVANSAGANLAMRLLLRLREDGLTMPHSVALLSPWIDLDLRSESVSACSQTDPSLQNEQLRRFAGLYRNCQCGPRVLDSNFRGLPPTLIQAGSDEILRDDSSRLADELKAAGVPTALEIWPDLFHVWHTFWPWLPEARQAISRVGSFLRQ